MIDKTNDVNNCRDEALVSIIIPVYKVEKYLKECVDSVLSQTYKNLEIILVDDGSPDNCPKICDEYAEKDSRIKVIHKENGGASAARNTAMTNICGEYTMFVDSDDYIDLNLVSRTVDLIKLHNTDIVQCQYAREKEKLGGEDSISTGILSEKDVYEDILVFKKVSPLIWSKLYKTSLIKDIRYNEACYCLNDVEFLTKVMQHATCYVDSFVGYYYRATPNSLITQGLTTRKLQGSLACQNSCISMLKETSLKSRSYTFKYTSLFNWLIRTAKQKDWKVFYKMIKKETKHEKSHILACKGISKKAKIVFMINIICSPLAHLVCKRK